jgi:hypothetical protein
MPGAYKERLASGLFFSIEKRSRRLEALVMNKVVSINEYEVEARSPSSYRVPN